MLNVLIKKYMLPGAMDKRWWTRLAFSLLAPALILLLKPIGLNDSQAAVASSVLLTIIWWSSGIVKKIPASLFMLVMFVCFSGVSAGTIFSFPLSETFPMIVITYLFSQGIANSGLIERIFQPLLMRFIHTPGQCLLAIAAMFFVMIYVVPQPLARVIIVAAVFHRFLKQTELPERTKEVLMYGVFLTSAVVNVSVKDADMLINYMAASFSETPITNGMWMKYMLLPSLVTCVAVGGLFVGVFRKELLGLRLTGRLQGSGQSGAVPTAAGESRLVNRDPESSFTGRQKAALAVITATALLWMTNGIHGINSTWITIVSTAILFALGILHKKDWKAIDITTMIFLTAAFSIGGVMKACGAADKVFGLLQGIFPEEFSVMYLLLMVFVTMVLHMVLGSNTTTLSVVVPGMMVLCGHVVPASVIIFASVVSVSFHAILPFHSVAVMIGASAGYFPAKHMARMGIPLTVVVYLLAAWVYLPYWRLMGLFAGL